MKAMIIYQAFAAAAKANTALQNSALCADISVQWNIRPWRADLLRFPPTAEEALTDATDAHLIVFAGCCAQPPPFWLQGWLEKWARRRQIRDVALAVMREGNANARLTSAMPELSEFAVRHGLHFIFDNHGSLDPFSVERRSAIIEGPQREFNPIRPQSLNAETRDAYRGWSIAE